MRSYLLTALWGVVVWFFATLFFVLFGKHVLYSPGTPPFKTNIIILVAVTGILLFAVTFLYQHFDKSKNAALKFGLIGTFLGLILDSFSLSNYYLIFPKLNESQIIAFTVWMSCAYALYLMIPTIMNVLQRRQKSEI